MIRVRQIQRFLSIILIVFLGISSLSLAQGNGKGKKNPKPKDKYRIVVTPADAKIFIGMELQFSAQVIDSSGNPVEFEDEFIWSLTGKKIGTIDSTGLFVGSERGSARVVATIGKLSGKTTVKVVEENTGKGVRLKVWITPRDTVVAVGDSLIFTAELVDSSGSPVDTTFEWEVRNSDIANINGVDQNTALFSALARGNTFVYARAGDLVGKAHVTILRDSTEWWYRYRGFKIRVEPRDTTLQIGESVQFSASLADSAGNVIDTVFTWSVDGGGFGTVDSTTGLFTALAKGQGFVWAHVGDLSGKGHVTVLRDKGEHWSNRKDYRLVIQPENELVYVDDYVPYRAFLVDSLHDSLEVFPTWELLGQKVGRIDEEGLFLAMMKGTGVIKAKFEKRYTRTTRVRVITELDSTEKDSANIQFRDKDGNPMGNIHQVGESDILKISGLSFPLNILNGGEIYLPPGSIDQGIWIDITLPETALVGDSSVTFMDEILTGVAFHVYVNDTLVSPFDFGETVQIILPYKPDLMETLGIFSEDLWVFFYTDEGFDTTGVFNVVVDTAEQKVYVEVSHFSEVVLASKEKVVTSVQTFHAQPEQTILYENYPNPFNPETEIHFDLSGHNAQRIQLEVFNILGQKVRTLLDDVYAAGHYRTRWDGKDDEGHYLGTGIYIYRLKGLNINMSRRMVLIR